MVVTISSREGVVKAIGVGLFEGQQGAGPGHQFLGLLNHLGTA